MQPIPTHNVYAEKPPYGSPCNGCGQCCEDQLCPLGQHVFHMQRGPCPALRYVDNKSTCGLVAEPRKFAPVRTAARGVDAMRSGALVLIGAGHGCDAKLDSEPDNSEARVRMIASASTVPDAATWAACRSWGIKT